MNGRKAKKLRRLAEKMTVGKPKVFYHQGGLVKTEWKKVIGKKGFKYLSQLIFNQGQRGKQLRLGDCTRYVYQRLKKAQYNKPLV